MDALRTAVSAWGATQDLPWPADHRAGPRADLVLAVGAGGVRPAARRPGADRAGPVARPGRGLPLPAHRERPDAGTARALDAYFIVGAEHGFNASTFTARVVTSTRSDIASAVTAAIGTMKGPLHGGAPSEVVDQLARWAHPSTPRSGSAARSIAASG